MLTGLLIHDDERHNSRGRVNIPLGEVTDRKAV